MNGSPEWTLHLCCWSGERLRFSTEVSELNPPIVVSFWNLDIIAWIHIGVVRWSIITSEWEKPVALMLLWQDKGYIELREILVLLSVLFIAIRSLDQCKLSTSKVTLVSSSPATLLYGYS